MELDDSSKIDLVYDYCKKWSTPPNPNLLELERETNIRTVAPNMLSGPLQSRFLQWMVEMCQAKNVLEIGTFTGYATIHLAKGLPADGKLISIDFNDELDSIIQNAIEKENLQDKIQIKYGYALDILPTLEDTFDFVFIDAAKGEYIQYFELLLPKIRKGGWIVADNILWKGRVISEGKKDKMTRFMDDFNQYISKDDRVENLILPFRDGLNIIRKK